MMRAYKTTIPKRSLKQQLDLLRVLVNRNLTTQYKRSVLGIFWSLLNPLLLLVVFYFVFRVVLAIDIPRYSPFVFIGLLVFTWFQSSLLQSAGAITESRDLIRQSGFPTAILPIVTVATNLVYFVMSIPVLVVFLVTGSAKLTLVIFLLPLVMGLQFILTLSFAYLIATANVTFRDTQHLLGVVLTLFFYITPIFYHADSVPSQYAWIYQFNPMSNILNAYRAILLDGILPDLQTLGIWTVVATVLLVVGYKIFVRASYCFVEEL